MGHFNDDYEDPAEYDMAGLMVNYDPQTASRLKRIVFSGEDITRTAYMDAPMLEDARLSYDEAFARMKRAGATVLICSKQPTAAQQRYTADWLEDHGVEFDGLAFATDSKGCFGLDWLLDDRYKHVLEVVRNGGRGVLRARRHNRPDRKRAKRVVGGLSEFADLVCEEAEGARNKGWPAM
jgi:hypothetical protein